MTKRQRVGNDLAVCAQRVGTASTTGAMFSAVGVAFKAAAEANATAGLVLLNSYRAESKIVRGICILQGAVRGRQQRAAIADLDNILALLDVFEPAEGWFDMII